MYAALKFNHSYIIGAELIKVARDVVLLSPGIDCILVWYNDGHHTRLEAVTIDIGLSHVVRCNVHILDLLRSKVFTLQGERERERERSN